MEHKSEFVMQTALANGWKAQIKPEIPTNPLYLNQILWILYAIREPEYLRVIWEGDRFVEAEYDYHGHKRYPTHQKAVIKIIEGKPSIRNLGLTADELMETRIIPFELSDPAMTILLAVLGKEITWVRKMDNEIMHGTVEKHTNLGKPYFRIYKTSTDRRILEWQDRTGFHAVGLDQIISVE